MKNIYTVTSVVKIEAESESQALRLIAQSGHTSGVVSVKLTGTTIEGELQNESMFSYEKIETDE